MKRVLVSVLMLVTIAGCGSDGNGGGGFPPTVSTPPPPVTVPLDGTYDLVVDPAAACSLLGAPYVVRVEVTTFPTESGDQLRGSLPTGGDQLTLDMLYPTPGYLQGSLSTRSPTPIEAGGFLFLRVNGVGQVSLSTDGRAQIVAGVMVGDVRYDPDGGSPFNCSSNDHRWALLPR